MPDRTPSDMWDTTTERAGEALDAATERATALASTAATASRVTVRQRLAAMRWATPAVLQTAVGAAAAWLIAEQLIGQQNAFFAPVSATIALGLGYGQRTRRAVELSVGVAVGIGVADLIVTLLGSGGWQIGIIVALAMYAAIGLGGQPLVVRQAASSAVLVATISVPGDGRVFDRFLDACIGGAVAIAINLLVSPVDPVALVKRSAEPLLDEMAGALDDLATALDTRDHDATLDVVARMRDVDAAVRALAENVGVGAETARFAPLRRRQRPEIARFMNATQQLDIAQRNVRVLARGVLRAVDLDAHVPPDAVAAIRDLATAVRALRAELLHPDQAPAGAARTAALHAAGRTAIVLESTRNLSISVIVGTIRSTAVDLLRGMGMEGDEARDAVRAATDEIQAEALARPPDDDTVPHSG